MDFRDLLAQNSVICGKIGEEVVRWWPQRTHSHLWGLLPHCHFWRKSIKKCDPESVDRQTDRQTHTVTETNWIYSLSYAICYNYATCYSYGADNTLTICYYYYYYYYKTKMESLSLSCKSRHSKTANSQYFIRNFNAQTLVITFMSVGGLW